MCAYIHTHAYSRPSCKSSPPPEQGRPSAEVRAPTCDWLFLEAAWADEIMAQNKVTGIFKLQKEKSTPGLILLILL